ncbi:methyltransferase-like protein 2 isoform X1 [Senna tora]|uniref:Methyltransferase-like protein 2 isoform X1 n=1 Tax=Senna tora TaxID=362788 RepID=A0A834SRW9_9FABA|nr:methyltransferase-like protein 2 isoform X1 [Senna tora]
MSSSSTASSPSLPQRCGRGTLRLSTSLLGMEEEDSQNRKKLALFMESGFFVFEDSNAIFIDPVRVLNRSYNRFREARSFLLKAHESLQKSTGLLDALRNLRNNLSCSTDCGDGFCGQKNDDKDRPEQRVLLAFNNFVANETTDDAEADFLNNVYIIPRESFFYMSDVGQIHNLIPAHPNSGFNLIVIDPPWENASAHQKSSEFGNVVDEDQVGVEVDDFADTWREEVGEVIAGIVQRVRRKEGTERGFKEKRNFLVILSLGLVNGSS